MFSENTLLLAQTFSGSSTITIEGFIGIEHGAVFCFLFIMLSLPRDAGLLTPAVCVFWESILLTEDLWWDGLFFARELVTSVVKRFDIKDRSPAVFAATRSSNNFFTVFSAAGTAEVFVGESWDSQTSGELRLFSTGLSWPEEKDPSVARCGELGLDELPESTLDGLSTQGNPWSKFSDMSTKMQFYYTTVILLNIHQYKKKIFFNKINLYYNTSSILGLLAW